MHFVRKLMGLGWKLRNHFLIFKTPEKDREPLFKTNAQRSQQSI